MHVLGRHEVHDAPRRPLARVGDKWHAWLRHRIRRAHEHALARTADGHRRERGAVLVEAALLTPIILLLVFGTMEMGYAFYGKLTVNHMSVAGARAASGGANDVLSDYSTLQAVEDAATGYGDSDISLIVIYRAANTDDRVPNGCLTASVTNSASVRGCNRYTGASLALASTQFGCVGPPGPTTKIDNFWCPTTRKTALLPDAGNGPPDYVGVYVKAVHHNLFGLFGPSFTFTSDTVIKIEPRTLK
jgi:Flp pilus assembly protein TadG